jgi:hypothetical protein
VGWQVQFFDLDVNVWECVFVVIDVFDDDSVGVMMVVVVITDGLDVLDMREKELVDVVSGTQLGRTVEEPL